jgi:SEC-C motif
MAKIQRNEPCPCGSGRKFKKCCGSATVAMAKTGVRLERSVRAYSDETGNSGNNLLAIRDKGRGEKVLLHKILRVAHSVAQKAAKVAQNTPFLCSTAYRKLLICIRWEYYLANFKTAAFNHSATPPH